MTEGKLAAPVALKARTRATIAGGKGGDSEERMFGLPTSKLPCIPPEFKTARFSSREVPPRSRTGHAGPSHTEFVGI